MCILALAGPVLAAPAAEDLSQLLPPGDAREASPATVVFARGDDLIDELPESMEVIGRYEVTIDPAEVFAIQPINLDNPIQVKRDTPIGALDAVARTGALNYSTYLYTATNRLILDSVDDYLYQGKQVWLVIYENGSYITSDADVWEHSVSDGETIWFIYCDLTDYEPRYESRLDYAIAGLSIKVTHGTNVTPVPVTPVPVTPVPVTPVPVTPVPVGEQSLIDVIATNDNLSFFAVLLNATDLVTTLQSGGPYTVFAPNNDAFGNLSREAFSRILVDQNERTRVLSAHVVNGSYTTADLLDMTQGGNTTTLSTLAGENLTVSANGSVLYVNNATITVPDINASNGVIHIIDKVLGLPAEGPAPITTPPVVTPTPTTPAVVTPMPITPPVVTPVPITPPVVTPMSTMPMAG